jgi:class 3 adenylate cyclase/pimeloyl-ACP methyl ester carboxylesterase
MARTQVVTILFCDLVASTERRARLGDDAFDEFTRQFRATLDDAIAQNNGRNIASAGDGLMVVFADSVADAVACATTMHRAAAVLDPREPPQLRIGISTGEVAQDGDGYSGMPIVEAARLEAAASPGQTLANAVVRTLVGTRRALRFRDIGALTLKGIPAPLSAVEVLDDQVLDSPSQPRGAPASAPPATTADATAPTSARRRLPLVAAAIAVLVVAATVGVALTRSGSGAHEAVTPPAGITAPKTYTPRYVPATCPASVVTVASDAKCGHLIVPQNRGEPDGRKISLLVTTAPPRLSGPTVDPTIDVCGCENLGSSLARDHSELIHVATRGFVDSDPVLTCPEMTPVLLSALASPSFDATEIARSTNTMRRCRARLVATGIDPAQYNYAAAAHDLLDLMVALHVNRANFVAFEGADAEVFEVLREAPAAVRSITLDNPPPPGTGLLTDPIGDLAGAFGRFVAQCDANAICARAYPDLARANQSNAAKLSEHPSLVTTANPYGSNLPAVRILLDGPRSADALTYALSEPSTYPLIPQAIDPTNQPTALATVAAAAAQVDTPPPAEQATWGASASYICASDINTQDAEGERLQAQTLPQFVQAHSAEWNQWCKAWNVPDVSALLSRPVVSNVPALFFRGDLAPDGNPNWIPTTSRGLANAQTVVFPTLGSDLLAGGPPCLSALRRQFLANPDATLDTTACEKQSPAIQFVAPGG